MTIGLTTATDLWREKFGKEWVPLVHVSEDFDWRQILHTLMLANLLERHEPAGAAGPVYRLKGE